jgi:hypothetical protein
MGLLDRFEQSMERLLEGTSGSLFRQKLQPADLGKRLQRAMLSKRLASVGGAIVPNQFVIRLNPRDYAQFESFQAGLARQLESHLAQVADRQNVSLVDRITVTLEPDASVRQRQPVVDANITNDARQAPPRPRTHRPPVGASRPDATSAFEVPARPKRHNSALVAVDGTTYDVPEGQSTIGRSPDNTIVLNSPDVSRRHAGSNARARMCASST